MKKRRIKKSIKKAFINTSIIITIIILLSGFIKLISYNSKESQEAFNNCMAKYNNTITCQKKAFN
jgi:hypothetical protein